jgi:hypothetical protein
LAFHNARRNNWHARMSTIDRPFQVSDAPRGLAYNSLLLAVFAGTLFVSATLLFSVQPMFTKMVLPLLGGSPSVWSVAMVFFQAVLLLGYGYAHALTRWLDPRRAVIVHLAVFAIAFAALPIAVAQGFGRPPNEYAAFWLIGLFAASIGLPFFAVAANAPMLQAWFARTGHPQALDPYFLYGASNLGSFCALLAYPVLLEPMLTLRDQSKLWSGGFLLLMLLIAACGALLTATMRQPREQRSGHVVAAAAPTWRERMTWMGLAFVPSALLIAVTSHISTDIAAAPFLWVVPLALFLATFILTFRAGGSGVHAWMLRLQPIVAAPLVIGLMGGERAYWEVAILLDLSMFVISTMICHRELYLRRPDASHLTGFYMWISVGGVLGGICSGLIAPIVFPDVWEYPILIVLALLCRPGAFNGGIRPWLRQGPVFLAAIVLAAIPALLLGMKMPPQAEVIWMIGLVALAAVIMLQAEHPVRLVGFTALVLVITAIYHPGTVQTETARSFFGVHKVVESYDGRFRMLYHGTTLHGAQRLRDDAGNLLTGRPEPLTYFYPGGPISEVIAATRAAKGSLNRVAVVGLGTGSLVCHAKAGERWSYYEIDPVVARIAQDASKFRFIADCAPNTNVILGDGRLTIADAAEPYDFIMLDAFSSDSVPVHLLTREAVSLYLSKLTPGGVIGFNVSNRYLELASVVNEVAASQGLVSYQKLDTAITGAEFKKNMYASAFVVVMARREEDLAGLRNRPGWSKYQAAGSVRAWTDDYSNILSAFWRMHRISARPAPSP